MDCHKIVVYYIGRGIYTVVCLQRNPKIMVVHLPFILNAIITPLFGTRRVCKEIPTNSTG